MNARAQGPKGNAVFGAIFDWDGVIVDSSLAHERAWERLAKEERRTLPADHFTRGFGRKNERVIPEVLGWTEDPAEIRRLSLRKEELYRETMRADGVTLIPGARELLVKLGKSGVPCIVGSSTPLENLIAAFRLTDLGNFFVDVVASEDVSSGKPDPEVFLVAAGRLGIEPPSCVVFEDMPVGVEAARRAGMKVVGVATTNAADALKPADIIVADLNGVTVSALTALFG